MAFGFRITRKVGMPLAPKGANMELIQGRCFAVHTPRGVYPLRTAGPKT